MTSTKHLTLSNARITGTFLGIEDHDCMTAIVFLDYSDGGSQGFGCRILGGAYTNAFVEGVLRALKVEKWEDLKGKYVQALHENSCVHAIGIIMASGYVHGGKLTSPDQWFEPGAAMNNEPSVLVPFLEARAG